MRDLRKRLARAEALAADRLRQLREIEESTSWRATKPLRTAKRRLSGAPEPGSPSTLVEPVPPPVPPGGFEPTEHNDHGLWRKPWREGEDPPQQVFEIPAMITDDERRLLHWLTREYWSGAGRILDAGSYLGGSTAALASGLAARPDAPEGRPIASYDLFLIDYFMLADLPEDSELDEGDSFRPLFDSNIAEYERFVEVRAGDIVEHGWSGEPIEIAFLDVLKTWPVNDFVLENFFGSMIPGRTIIVQQDFVHEFAPWIHVTMGMLDPYVELLDMFDWCSAVYLLREPIPEEVLKTKTARDLTAAELVDYMDIAIAPATGEVRGTLEVAKAALLLWVEGFDAMQSQLDRVHAEYEGSERVRWSIEVMDGWGTQMGYRELKLRGKRRDPAPVAAS